MTCRFIFYQLCSVRCPKAPHRSQKSRIPCLAAPMRSPQNPYNPWETHLDPLKHPDTFFLSNLQRYLSCWQQPRCWRYISTFSKHLITRFFSARRGHMWPSKCWGFHRLQDHSSGLTCGSLLLQHDLREPRLKPNIFPSLLEITLPWDATRKPSESHKRHKRQSFGLNMFTIVYGCPIPQVLVSTAKMSQGICNMHCLQLLDHPLSMVWLTAASTWKRWCFTWKKVESTWMRPTPNSTY